MELRQLRYFVEVAEREHVSEAAVHLHIAQSAVSRQISKLEDELGILLFEKTGRNIQLTTIGKIFLFHAKTAIQAIEYAKYQIEEFLDPEHGTIKIGFPTSLSTHLLPTVISAFKDEQPNIGFHLRQDLIPLKGSRQNREIGLAFLGPIPINDPDIEGHILFTENISALLPITHPLAERKSLRLSDLRNDPFVLFPKGYILHSIAIEACKAAGFAPNITSEGEDMDSIKGLVSAGIGVSLLPDSTFYEVTPRLTVKIPIDTPEVKRTVGIITPKTGNWHHRKNFSTNLPKVFSVLEQYQ